MYRYFSGVVTLLASGGGAVFCIRQNGENLEGGEGGGGGCKQYS